MSFKKVAALLVMVLCVAGCEARITDDPQYISFHSEVEKTQIMNLVYKESASFLEGWGFKCDYISDRDRITCEKGLFDVGFEKISTMIQITKRGGQLEVLSMRRAFGILPWEPKSYTDEYFSPLCTELKKTRRVLCHADSGPKYISLITSLFLNGILILALSYLGWKKIMSKRKP